MRWLADENIPRSAIAMLREHGEDVIAVAEARAGMTDHEVLAMAVADQRILLTFDRDHGDLIFNGHIEPPPGVVYVRIVPVAAEQLGQLLLQLIKEAGDTLVGFLTVVSKSGMRQRGFP